MGVVMFILAGLLHIVLLLGAIGYGATAGDQTMVEAEAAINVAGIIVWALSAWAFLATVFPAKKFLSEDLHIELESFSSTVFAFAIPFVNFYLPWRRLATIRNSLTHYLKTGESEEHEGGHGATIILAVLYLLQAVLSRLAGAASDAAADTQTGIFLLAGCAWLLSFIYAVFWLWTLSAKRTRAKKALAKLDPSVASVFA